MTEDLETDDLDSRDPQGAVAAVFRVLDAIPDPVERYQATKDAREAFDEGVRATYQHIALDLRERGTTWREIGGVMGGVSAQRAEQISRGV